MIDVDRTAPDAKHDEECWFGGVSHGVREAARKRAKCCKRRLSDHTEQCAGVVMVVVGYMRGVRDTLVRGVYAIPPCRVQSNKWYGLVSRVI